MLEGEHKREIEAVKKRLTLELDNKLKTIGESKSSEFNER